MIQHHFTIEAGDFNKAGEIAIFLKKELKKRLIDPQIIRRIVIAGYEAEINVVIHSVGGVCEVIITDDKIQATFKDDGPGIINIKQAMTKGFSTANQQALSHGFGAGMGLINIRNAVDDFKLTSSQAGTILTFTVYFKGD